VTPSPVPRPPSPSRGVEPVQFRELLGRFATGVTVVTSRSPKGEPVGMTASSVASVSLNPPLVLVSVDKTHDMHAALENGSHFVLNILAAEQEALSRRFAADEPDRFRGVSYRENDRGIAVIDGVVAHIECQKQSAVPGGDHTVFIGLVVGGETTDRRPLLYYRGGYAELSR
jgi:flavin reductase (DIM6/NTAB) family NADH-FMN oxidoreductase RutF